MIKVKVNNEYKDVVKIFCGGTLQKEIIKVWSREAQEYVYESSIEYTGSLPITINANGDALIDYRIYGTDGGVGVATESGEPAGYKLPMTVQSANLFDKNTAIDGYEITGSGIHQSSAWCISDFIPVVTGEFYIGNNLGNAVLAYQSKTGTPTRLSGINYGITLRGDINFIVVNLRISNKNIASIVQLKATPPVYIGENQLDAGEYVSYGEQKIYRMVDGTLTPTDPPVPLPKIPTIDGTTVIDYDGDPKPSQMYAKYRR